jgi:hypothetical protein
MSLPVGGGPLAGGDKSTDFAVRAMMIECPASVSGINRWTFKRQMHAQTVLRKPPAFPA